MNLTPAQRHRSLEPPRNDWISVEERVPASITEKVLVWDNFHGHRTALHDKQGWFTVGDLYPLEYVTHWQPLPEKPK